MGCVSPPSAADADLIVVGAGPAGLAAAVEARKHGARVLLLDENPAPGGRIWQALRRRGASDADEAAGIALLDEFAACGADARFGAGVWGIEDATVFWSQDGAAHVAHAPRILLATGTTERPMPIPGWTLPGVMTVGAAQIAWKTGGLVPAERTWIAGQGPLIWLYAAQVLRAGGRIAGIIDLAPRAARWEAARHVPAAWRDVRKGLGWLREVRRAGVPIWRATDVRAEGDTALRQVVFQAGGARRTEAADLLLLHDGVVPSIQFTSALGCAHIWDERQQCWRPDTDAWGGSSIPGVSIAGDGAGIGGAAAAVLSGRLAALGALHGIGRIDAATRDRAAVPLRARHAAALASRPLLDTLFPARPVRPDDSVLICRCEEVTAGEIRAAARTGCQGLNQLKAFTRCGMGPCQGRMCASSAAALLADARGVQPRDIPPYHARFPTRPLTVGELAALES